MKIEMSEPILLQQTNLFEEYIKGGIQKVEGWLDPDAISIITKLAQAQNEFDIKGHVGEIGVHHGKLFILLYLLTNKGENAIAIDIFEKQHLNVDQSGKGDLEQFLQNLETFAKDKEKLKIISSDSTQVSSDDIKNSVGGELRLFSVDGGHTPEIARSDLRLASKSICEGGVIVLDDCFNGLFPGVSEGANQFFIYDNDRGIVPFAIGTHDANKVFFTTSSYADKYIEYLLQCNLANVGYTRQTEFFGHRVISLHFMPPNPSLKSLIWEKIKDKLAGK